MYTVSTTYEIKKCDVHEIVLSNPISMARMWSTNNKCNGITAACIYNPAMHGYCLKLRLYIGLARDTCIIPVNQDT